MHFFPSSSLLFTFRAEYAKAQIWKLFLRANNFGIIDMLTGMGMKGYEKKKKKKIKKWDAN